MPTSTAQTMSDGRKVLAEEAIKKAFAKGHKLRSKSDVIRILKDTVDFYRLPADFFKDLTDGDIIDLLLTGINECNNSGLPSTGIPTPPDIEDCLDSQDIPQLEGGQVMETDQEDPDNGANAITFAESEPIIKVLIQHPNAARVDITTARRCNEKESYISKAIVRRNKFLPLLSQKQSIRLTWNEFAGSNSGKTASTRFKMVEDDIIETDMVIGKDCHEPDDDDLELEDFDHRLTIDTGRRGSTWSLAEPVQSPTSSDAQSSSAVAVGELDEAAEFSAKFFAHLRRNTTSSQKRPRVPEEPGAALKRMRVSDGVG